MQFTFQYSLEDGIPGDESVQTGPQWLDRPCFWTSNQIMTQSVQTLLLKELESCIPRSRTNFVVNSGTASPCSTFPVPTWPTDVRTNWMPSSNIVHTDQIYYHAFLCLFALLKKKNLKAIHSRPMAIRRRLMYSDLINPPKSLQTGYVDMCINASPF